MRGENRSAYIPPTPSSVRGMNGRLVPPQWSRRRRWGLGDRSRGRLRCLRRRPEDVRVKALRGQRLGPPSHPDAPLSLGGGLRKKRCWILKIKWGNVSCCVPISRMRRNRQNANQRKSASRSRVEDRNPPGGVWGRPCKAKRRHGPWVGMSCPGPGRRGRGRDGQMPMPRNPAANRNKNKIKRASTIHDSRRRPGFGWCDP